MAKSKKSHKTQPQSQQPKKTAFVYTCTKDGLQATKPALVAVPGWKTATLREFGGLGGWRCPKCGPCKVQRQKVSLAA